MIRDVNVRQNRSVREEELGLGLAFRAKGGLSHGRPGDEAKADGRAASLQMTAVDR